MKKRKWILIICLSVLAVAAIAATAILLGSSLKDYVQTDVETENIANDEDANTTEGESADIADVEVDSTADAEAENSAEFESENAADAEADTSTVVYLTFEEHKGNNTSYNLSLCQVDSIPVTINSNIFYFKVSLNRKMITYFLEDDNYFKSDVYLTNGTSVNELISNNVTTYLMSRYGNVIAYQIDGNDDTLIIQEYNDKGSINSQVSVDLTESSLNQINSVGGGEINSVGTGIVLTRNSRSMQDGEYKPCKFDWADIVVYYNGEVEKIAEKAFLSNADQSISNDGSVLYLADVNEETSTGTLYLKEIGKEAITITENAYFKFGISDDRGLIFVWINDNGEEELFYQYSGQDAVIVDNILMALMCQNSNTLVYTLKTDNKWESILYRVEENEEPEMISDNVSFLLDISEDGKSVAYLANFSEEEQTGDLYIAKEGEGVELIDTGVAISGRALLLGDSTVNISSDGNTIAYLKNYESIGIRGDLYVKKKGEEPKKIDENVRVGFDFFG